ncbi:hypothetical protein GMA11_06675 [Granulicatella sp. zg-ZJ]|uniref:hypothetical protein n=1 Tax=Granulicatella sp. zg-ZJ TaxID=2678504 RepID=UPI0013D8223E|nr:hypothetical protein [Granulicatella sp. zg-ZJ]NEW63078.1 hypothetical protein [Granulicatella sp. zg-ZJ]
MLKVLVKCAVAFHFSQLLDIHYMQNTTYSMGMTSIVDTLLDIYENTHHDDHL